MSGVLELVRETRPTIRVPTCNECGVSYHPLYEKECGRCGGGLIVMECPSCLDQEEFYLHRSNDEDRGASLAARRHVQRDGEEGFWTTEVEAALLVWSRR